MKIAYTDKNFRRDTLVLIRTLNEIAESFKAQGMRLTVRQLFYQCVARNILPNSEASYQKVIRVCTDAREAGLMDWDMIEDRARELVKRTCWDSPAQILRAAASSYHEDRWDSHDIRPLVVLEKSALAGILEPVCWKWDTPLLAARGYSSATLFFEIAQEHIVRYAQEGQDVVVLHLGDHDPSGLDMTRDLEARLSLYAGTDVNVRRIALNMDQIEELKPPHNPAKETDKRFNAYKRRYGDKCWELDAMPPEMLADVTEQAIREYIDIDMWQQATEEIELKRDKLLAIAEQMQ